MPTDRTNKKVIIVTGGSEGLGKEIAAKLNGNSSNEIIVLSNNKSCLTETGAQLSCDCRLCDITDPAQIEKSVADILEKYGRIDCLINNAGVWASGELDELSYNDVARIVMVNTVGTMYMTKAVIPVMKKQKSGKIVNIGSYDGTITKSERGPYVASKWAVTGFTGAMRKELQKYNIGVYGLYPGLMNTNLFKNADGKRDLTTAMDPKEVARIVEFVISFDNIVFDEVVFRSLESETY